MKQSTSKFLLAGAWAAASCSSVIADGTLHLYGNTGVTASSHQVCHRPFPSFLWSGTQVGEHSKLGYQHGSMDVQDVASMLVDTHNAVKSVDVAIIVLSKESSFSTSGVADANALAQLKRGKGSHLHCHSATTTFPYTYPSSTAVSEVLPLLATVTGASVHETSLGEMSSVLSGKNSMLTDGELDLVVVTVPEGTSIEETDAAVRGATTMLEKETNGRFLLMWTGDFHGQACGRRALAAETRKARSALTVNRRRLSDDSDYLYRSILITPDILSGVLVMILFVFILSVGYGCVGDIECPQSFPKVNPAKGKEY